MNPSVFRSAKDTSPWEEEELFRYNHVETHADPSKTPPLLAGEVAALVADGGVHSDRTKTPHSYAKAPADMPSPLCGSTSP